MRLLNDEIGAAEFQKHIERMIEELASKKANITSLAITCTTADDDDTFELIGDVHTLHDLLLAGASALKKQIEQLDALDDCHPVTQ